MRADSVEAAVWEMSAETERHPQRPSVTRNVIPVGMWLKERWSGFSNLCVGRVLLPQQCLLLGQGLDRMRLLDAGLQRPRGHHLAVHAQRSPLLHRRPRRHLNWAQVYFFSSLLQEHLKPTVQRVSPSEMWRSKTSGQAVNKGAWKQTKADLPGGTGRSGFARTSLSDKLTCRLWPWTLWSSSWIWRSSSCCRWMLASISRVLCSSCSFMFCMASSWLQNCTIDCHTRKGHFNPCSRYSIRIKLGKFVLFYILN